MKLFNPKEAQQRKTSEELERKRQNSELQKTIDEQIKFLNNLREEVKKAKDDAETEKLRISLSVQNKQQEAEEELRFLETRKGAILNSPEYMKYAETKLAADESIIKLKSWEQEIDRKIAYITATQDKLDTENDRLGAWRVDLKNTEVDLEKNNALLSKNRAVLIEDRDRFEEAKKTWEGVKMIEESSLKERKIKADLKDQEIAARMQFLRDEQNRLELEQKMVQSQREALRAAMRTFEEKKAYGGYIKT